jgi:hypothetical protein
MQGDVIVIIIIMQTGKASQRSALALALGPAACNSQQAFALALALVMSGHIGSTEHPRAPDKDTDTVPRTPPVQKSSIFAVDYSANLLIT